MDLAVVFTGYVHTMKYFDCQHNLGTKSIHTRGWIPKPSQLGPDGTQRA